MCICFLDCLFDIHDNFYYYFHKPKRDKKEVSNVIKRINKQYDKNQKWYKRWKKKEGDERDVESDVKIEPVMINGSMINSTKSEIESAEIAIIKAKILEREVKLYVEMMNRTASLRM